MATVRITKDIVYHVRQKIREMFDLRIATETVKLDQLNIGQICYEHYIPAKYRQLVAELNQDPKGQWLSPTDQLFVTVKFARRNGSPTYAHITVPFRPPAPLPLRYGHNTAYRFELLPGMPAYEETRLVLLAVEDLKDERDRILQQLVQGVLEKCSTLKQVLEHWPSVMDFLPESAHQLHAAPQEQKTRRSKPTIAIDDETKAAMIKARLLNTQNGSS